MFNAMLKIPMQFFILFVGVMVFIFYQFVQPPVYFKEPAVEHILLQNHKNEFLSLEKDYQKNFTEKRSKIIDLAQAFKNGSEIEISQKTDEVTRLQEESNSIKNEVKDLILNSNPNYDTKDSDYVFITFIMNFLPKGIVGLLLAVIFSAAMSSTSSELNALGSTSTIDIYKRLFKSSKGDKHLVFVSKSLTALWGVIAIIFAFIANQAENLIEAVNIVGSLFYGTILGIFIAAFFLKSTKATSIFISAIIAEVFIITLHFLNIFNVIDIGYLWYNVIGFAITISSGLMLSKILGK